jgi:hypothetical protein
MRKLHIAGLALFAALALSAVTAGSASAAQGGPQWIVVLCEKVAAKTGHWLKQNSSTLKCEERDAVAEGEWETKLMVLATGETEPDRSSGGKFILKSTTNMECATEQDTGELIGGTPGTDLTSIELLKCNVEKLKNCLVGNVTKENIEIKDINSVLVYPKAKAESVTEALDVFTPGGGTSNTFTEYTLETASGATTETCSLLNKVKVVVNATGTEIKEPKFEKKCGFFAAVGKLNGSAVFERTVSGEQGVVGALEFKGTPNEAELWNKATSSYGKIACSLEGFKAAMEVLGTTDVELTNEEEYGWEV